MKSLLRTLFRRTPPFEVLQRLGATGGKSPRPDTALPALDMVRFLSGQGLAKAPRPKKICAQLNLPHNGDYGCMLDIFAPIDHHPANSVRRRLIRELSKDFAGSRRTQQLFGQVASCWVASSPGGGGSLQRCRRVEVLHCNVHTVWSRTAFRGDVQATPCRRS